MITANFAGKILSVFGEFLCSVKKNVKQMELCKKFDHCNDRVDAFYTKTLAVTKYPAVFPFIQLVCCLSHGQSSVERGFSLNKDTAKQNMHEDSFIARRLVKDHLLANNVTPATFHINKDLILSCTGAR